MNKKAKKWAEFAKSELDKEQRDTGGDQYTPFMFKHAKSLIDEAADEVDAEEFGDIEAWAEEMRRHINDDLDYSLTGHETVEEPGGSKACKYFDHSGKILGDADQTLRHNQEYHDEVGEPPHSPHGYTPAQVLAANLLHRIIGDALATTEMEFRGDDENE